MKVDGLLCGPTNFFVHLHFRPSKVIVYRSGNSEEQHDVRYGSTEFEFDGKVALFDEVFLNEKFIDLLGGNGIACLIPVNIHWVVELFTPQTPGL